MKKVLAVLTEPSFWLEELATPYYAFACAGIGIDFASPSGGRPPVDPKSLESNVPEVRRFLDDRVAMAKLELTVALGAIREDYDGYLVVGGQGAMDLASSAGAFLGEARRRGKLVAAVSPQSAGAVAKLLIDGLC